MQIHSALWLWFVLANVEAQCPANFYASGPSTNVAVGKPTFASSYYAWMDSYKSANAVDDNINTWWAANPPYTVQYIGVDLQASFAITHIRFYEYLPGFNPDTYIVRAGDIGDTTTAGIFQYKTNPVCFSEYLNSNAAYIDLSCVTMGRYVGLYRENSGNMGARELQVWAKPCTPCPSMSTSPASSTAETSCVCNSGYTKVGTNPFVCAMACAAGSTGPSGSCTQCVPGKYKAASGSAPCDDCVPGKYSAATGASTAATCLSCSSSTYSETAGSPACTLCPSGKYSAGTGASTSTTCQCAAGATG